MHGKRLAWIGFFCLICVVFGWQADAIQAQEEAPEYAGLRECRSCHRGYASDHAESPHGMTLMDVAEAEEDDLEVILADFEAGEDIRTTTFPDGETRPFIEEDVFFTLGAGRNYQAYVMEVEEDIYRVLPAQWSIAEEAWVTLPLEGEWAEDPAYDFNSQCAGCHVTNFNAEDLTWDEAGVQCETCHGPGLTHVEIADDAGRLDEEEYAEVAAAINFALDSQVCGQCHVRGTSGDGNFPFPVDYLPGDNLLDEQIYQAAAPDNEELWYATGHASAPNMQFNEWLQSSHGAALDSARESEYFDATCIECHSVANQRADYLIDEGWVDEDEFDPLTTLDVHGFGVTCASCHNPHEIENDVHLIAETPYELCADCHTNGEDNEGIHHPVLEIYEGRALIENIDPVDGAHFTAEEGPTCTTCHMQQINTKNGLRSTHTFMVVSPGAAADIDSLQDSCTTCHTDIENPTQMQALIDSVQSNVDNRLRVAQEAAGDSAADWVSLSLAAVEGDGSMGIHNYAYTNALLSAVESELEIVGGTVSNDDVAMLVDDALPDIEQPEAAPSAPAVEAARGLTTPSLVLLAISGLIILFAAYSFFVRGGHDD